MASTSEARSGFDLEDYEDAVAGTRALPRSWDTAGTTEGVVIISVDSHVSPPIEAYRQYCPTHISRTSTYLPTPRSRLASWPRRH